MQVEEDSYHIRRNYPDEIKRIAAFLPAATRRFSRYEFILLTCGVPERIVGVAGLSFEKTTPENIPAVLLSFKILPRHASGGREQKLMDAVLQLAKDNEVKLLNLELPSDFSKSDFFKHNGFKYVKTEQLWTLDLATVMQRLERLSSRLKMPEDWQLRAPKERDLVGLREMAVTYNFRRADEVFFNTEKMFANVGYSREHCSVVEKNGVLIAALLVKGGPSTQGYVDMRMVAPEYIKHSSLLNLVLLERTVRLSLESGYLDTGLTINLERDTETLNLCKRMAGKLQSEKALWLRSADADFSDTVANAPQ